jgi:hypothetical protein
MITRCVKVMKKEDVAVGGSVRIRPGEGLAPVRTNVSSRTCPPTAGIPQQARIIESNAEYAIIEITCSCGLRSHIQCNYANIGKTD